MAFTGELTYAGVCFVNDGARPFRASPQSQGERGTRKHQPEDTLLQEIDRRFPFDAGKDISRHHDGYGRTVGQLARVLKFRQYPHGLKIGDFFYPCGATRCSIFRGLATSRQAKAMLAAVADGAAKTFTLSCDPHHGATQGRSYTVSTPMHLLPPRQVAEDAGAGDGLYLITLVDERFYWQAKPCTLRLTYATTWADLITALSTALGVSITYSAIDSAFVKPEPDSQLWTNEDDADILLDAVALNIGRVLVRSLAGTYSLLTPTESAALALASRRGATGVLPVLRGMGGDAFQSGAANLAAGDLRQSRDLVLPAAIRGSFPKYVLDPVPHFYDLRSGTAHHRDDSYGDVWRANVPVASGGPEVSGVRGFSGWLPMRNTAKAVFATDADAASGSPTNASGLTALTQKLAQTQYQSLALTGLDEKYEGTLVWQMEGLHDILWTWSQDRKQASTRVIRPEWDAAPQWFQHCVEVPIAGAMVPPPVIVNNYYNTDIDYYLTEINYRQDVTINYYNNVVTNYYSNTTFFIDNSVTINYYGFGIVIYYVGFEICSWWAWCYDTTTPFETDQFDWEPEEDKVVHRWSATEFVRVHGVVPKVFNGERQPQMLTVFNIETPTISLSELGLAADQNDLFRFPCTDEQKEGGANFVEGGPVLLGRNDVASLWFDPEAEESSGRQRLLFTSAHVPRIQHYDAETFGGDVDKEPNAQIIVISDAAPVAEGGFNMISMRHAQAGLHVLLINRSGTELRFVENSQGALYAPFLLANGELTLADNKNRIFVGDGDFWVEVTDTDERIKLDGDDDAPGWAYQKFGEGEYIYFSEDEVDEFRRLVINAENDRFAIDLADALASGEGFWSEKIFAGTNITFTSGTGARGKKITISASGGGGGSNAGKLISADIISGSNSTTSTTFVDLADTLTFTLDEDAYVLIEYTASALLPSDITLVEDAHNQIRIDTVAVTSEENFNVGATHGGRVSTHCHALAELAAGTHQIDVFHKTTAGLSVTWSRRKITVTQMSGPPGS